MRYQFYGFVKVHLVAMKNMDGCVIAVCVGGKMADEFIANGDGSSMEFW